MVDTPPGNGAAATDKVEREPEAAGGSRRGGRNPVTNGRRYLREVAAEMRKVVWPTRNELVTYTGVVLVFVTVMIALVFALDYVIGQGVLAVFG